MFEKRDMNSYTDLDSGKCQALFEFSKLAAKEGGYEEKGEVQNPSKEYFIPMISKLVGEKLVTTENEFDELMFVLQQYSSKTVHSQLDAELAKSGNKIEVLKFFAAIVYEFRVTHSAVFTRLCEAMSRLNQLQIAHFISYMDNAVRLEDRDWWRILFLPYADENINGLGMSICNNAIQTPHKTPSRGILAEKTIFDSPVYSVVNSPSGKDRVIQEYERRLKAERNLVQTLQVDYDESSAEIVKLKLEIEGLKEKLERASKNASSMCGEECPNKNEMAAMRVRTNIRENKFQKVSADLMVTRQELETASDTANKFRLENSRLDERIRFLTDENERLTNAFKELLDLRQKLATVIREKEELIIQRSTNDDMINKAQLLDTENGALKKENDDLAVRIAAKEEVIGRLQADLDAAKVTIADLKQKLNQSTEAPDLKAANSRLVSEHDALKKRYKNTDEQLLESKKENNGLKSDLEAKRRVIEHLTSQLNKANSYSAFGRPKPIEEPANMLNKSLFSSEPSFFASYPAKTSTPIKLEKSLAWTIKPVVSSSKKESGLDYKKRMEKLREENRLNPRHLRVHHGAFEIEAPYSPTATMKFEPK